ncbi:MAG: ribosome biosynthesis protein [Marteilia pararefringens]
MSHIVVLKKAFDYRMRTQSRQLSNCGAMPDFSAPIDPSDDFVFLTLSKSFCSYQNKTKNLVSCRNKNNLTGICARAACPLANTEYATVVMNDDNTICLKVKIPELRHQPSREWKVIELDIDNKSKALQQIKEATAKHTQWVTDKCKKKYLTFIEIAKNMQNTNQQKETLIPLKRKVENQEKRRAEKAFLKSRLHKSIEKQLEERLKTGYYDDLYDIKSKATDSIAEKDSEAIDEAELDAVSDEQEYFAEPESEEDIEVDIEELGKVYNRITVAKEAKPQTKQNIRPKKKIKIKETN